MNFDKLEIKEKMLHAYYDIPVAREFRNPSGPLHGGAYGLLADVATSMAICVIDPSEKQTVQNYAN